MTAPVTHTTTDGMLAQILVQLAVISEQLKAVPDHESRLRTLETTVVGFRSKVVGAGAAVSVIISAGSTWIGLVVTRR